MVAGLLSGMRVVEGAAFVAVPLGTMTLAQFGADVIRFDPIGGGIDYRRWPITEDGVSLYWAGLNKGKRSIALDLRSEEGRALVVALIAAPGPDSGIFLTNYPPGGWLDYETLSRHRTDLIMGHLVGDLDGGTAVDYTVNAAAGYPAITGPQDHTGVVNSVVPTWDLLAGVTLATGILAAERRRSRTGEGMLLRLPLVNTALAVLGHLGQIGEAQINGFERPRYGNYLYGAFGRDFVTADGHRVMVVAITPRQFRGVMEAAGLERLVADMEQRFGRPLQSDGDLFDARHEIAALLEPWFAATSLAEVAERFDQNRVLWGPYQTTIDLLHHDARASTANPMFAEVDHPGIGALLTPGSPFSPTPETVPPAPSPRLGEHTEEILATVLGLSEAEIGGLHDRKVIDGG
jgi:2-methylfumaryl-CoA isomerase